MDDPLDLINTYIVTNHNNEITAIVLNPVLQAIVLEYRDFIGDLNTLTTPDTEDLVQAINSLQTQFDGFTFEGVQVYSGLDDPNDTPPLSYNVADFYKQLDGGGDTIALFQYNGTIWKNLTEPVSVPTLQEVTDEGNETTENIIITNVDGTEKITYSLDKITYEKDAESINIHFETPSNPVNLTVPAKETDDTFAMLSDILSLPITLVITDANTIQHDRLIGLNTGSVPFPFMIQADNCTWTEYPADIFPDLYFDPITGTITGFTIEVGKTAYITINNIAYLT